MRALAGYWERYAGLFPAAITKGFLFVWSSELMKLCKVVLWSLVLWFGGVSIGYCAPSDLGAMEEQVQILRDDIAVLQDQLEETNQDNFNRMSISGYTDLEYHQSSASGVEPGFRLHHMSLFFEKRITERWKFFSEIEYEDGPFFEGSDGTIDEADGKIFLEAVNFTYFFHPLANFRGGRFFTPAGLWSVDHYPPFVPTQIRPEHIRQIFPQVVDGVTAFGTLPLGKVFLNYDAYVGNGEDANGAGDNDSHKATGAKFGLLLPVFKYFELGGSAYQDTLLTGTEKQAFGAHLKMKFWKLTLQSEWANASFDNAGATSNRSGYYGQLQYDTRHWTFGGRYDYYDADDTDSNDRTTSSAFVNYHVSDAIVLKLEHHIVDFNDNTADEDYDHTIASVVIYLGN
jgi:hypothetical protein